MAVTDLYAVAGKPVLQSRSPQMHNAAFKSLSLDARYVRLASESAREALGTALDMGLRGMNVTAPFKQDMAALVPAADEASRMLGAANTVLFGKDGPAGYNTDPAGVSGALRAAKVPVRGKKAVVLGAGGAAKAAVLALQAEGAAQITVANRTPANAEAIAGQFGCQSCGLPESGSALRDASIVVSALSTPERVLGQGTLHRGMAVLDAHYATESALAKDARKAGCRIIDGREWLLFQGAAAFALFCGRKAPLAAMRKAVYAPQAKRASGNVALIGMMGSGKDAVAEALCAATSMPAISTDKEIERKAGKRISEIFSAEGEEGFRRRESAAIAGLCKARCSVINCGGGAVISIANRRALKRMAMVAWLWADVKTMMQRIPQDGTRPLLAGAEPEKALEGLLAQRLGAYADASDIVVETRGRTPDEIARRIAYEIH